MNEPGLWAVVTAGVRQHNERLRRLHGTSGLWGAERDEYPRRWDELIDPVLYRPAIDEEQP